MPDKQRFVNELVRVVAPGGRVIIVTWCGISSRTAAACGLCETRRNHAQLKQVNIDAVTSA